MNLQTTLILFAVFLHALLLTLLFLRGAARTLPTFTMLIVFYLLRSLLLYGLFGHIDDDAYELFVNALDLLDLLLQVLVVWELFRKSGSSSSSPVPTVPANRRSSHILRRAALFIVLLLVSAVGAWAISFVVPAARHFPSDRGTLFTSALMLLTALTSITNPPSLGRRVLFGFGALGLDSILCQIGRTLAAFHRASLSYRRWSYIEAIAYVVIVLFWIGTIAARATTQKHTGSQATRLPHACWNPREGADSSSP